MHRRKFLSQAAALVVMPAGAATAAVGLESEFNTSIEQALALPSSKLQTLYELNVAEGSLAMNRERVGVLMVRTGEEIREIASQVMKAQGGYRFEYGAVPVVTVHGPNGTARTYVNRDALDEVVTVPLPTT